MILKATSKSDMFKLHIHIERKIECEQSRRAEGYQEVSAKTCVVPAQLSMYLLFIIVHTRRFCIY